MVRVATPMDRPNVSPDVHDSNLDPSTHYSSSMEEPKERPQHASSAYSEQELEQDASNHLSAETTTPSNAHFNEKLADLEAADYPGPSYTPTTLSSVSTAAYNDDIANGFARQILGAYEHDKSDDTLVGDFMTEWEPTDPPIDTRPLPRARRLRLWSQIRHRYFDAYQRLFVLVILGNIVALVVTMVQGWNTKPIGTSLQNIATATAANVTASILMRQEYVINLLYDILSLTPHSLPLRVRRTIAKLYHFGGVHSGCALSALIWFALYTALLTMQFADGTFRSIPVLVLTYVLVLLFMAICVFAIPQLRFKSHNTFEAFHRFGGWSAVALFWGETILVSWELQKTANAESFGLILIQTPAFWFLVTVTACIILPWLRLRKIQAWPEILSSNAARIHFNYTHIGKVVGIRIANNPLKEWHPFATIPEADGSSFSIIVSNAGDWTRRQIQNPSYSYWVRGVPISGILRMACIFKRVVVVTTGSGIGPCISLLIAHPLPCRVLWIARNPLSVYGAGTMGAVIKADSQAMVVDTEKHGRPSQERINGLAYQLYQESDAEAIFCVMRRGATYRLVYAMVSRGIPAYGPIWDS